MKHDGNLRGLFAENLPQIHWQKIESSLTGQGIPDINGCFEGKEFWIECKRTAGNRVKIHTMQCAWMERRTRAGGSTFLAVRRMISREKRDQFLLYRGVAARIVLRDGVSRVVPIVCLEGGPSVWDWKKIHKCLIS